MKTIHYILMKGCPYIKYLYLHNIEFGLMTRRLLRQRGDKKTLNCDKLLRNPLLRSQNPFHLVLLFHNPYTFESDLNTHNPEGLTEVQLCRINVNEPQKLHRMSSIRWGSRVFQVEQG